ncbi:MAG: Atg14 domain-containing protein [Verrucomicrobia bacterium]|nr:Atg14 domain-containing protein [Verrucomicrobiota bacterium]
MKRQLLYLCLAAGISTLAVNAQQQTQAGPGPRPEPVVAPQPLPQPSPEVVALRTELHALRTELEASRRAILEALGRNPDREAVVEALAAWRTEHADLIAEVEAIATEIRTLMADVRPGPMPVRPIPETISVLRSELVELRTELAKSRASVIAELGPDATMEDIRLALASWHAENAEAIEAMRSLSQEIAAWMRENRPTRPERPMENSAIRERREEMQQSTATLMRGASKITPGAGCGNPGRARGHDPCIPGTTKTIDAGAQRIAPA